LACESTRAVSLHPENPPSCSILNTVSLLFKARSTNSCLRDSSAAPAPFFLDRLEKLASIVESNSAPETSFTSI